MKARAELLMNGRSNSSMKPGRGVTVRRAAAALLCLGVAARAEANVGVPMLTVVWPVSWLLLLPIIAVEALVALRSTGLGWKKCITGAAIANAASAVLGIPLTWSLLVGLEMLLTRGGGAAFGLASPGARILSVTVQAPWLIPYGSDLDWMVPSAALVLLVPFFFASVFSESWFFKISTRMDSSVARRWSWRANAITYGCIFIVVAAMTVSALTSHDWSPLR